MLLAPERELPETRDGTEKRAVLVVCDDPRVLKYLCDRLKLGGIESIGLTSLRDVRRWVEEHPAYQPWGVMTDLCLGSGNPNGGDVIAFLKSDVASIERYILMSGYGPGEPRIIVIRSRWKDVLFLQKPIPDGMLVEALYPYLSGE